MFYLLLLNQISHSETTCRVCRIVSYNLIAKLMTTIMVPTIIDHSMGASYTSHYREREKVIPRNLVLTVQSGQNWWHFADLAPWKMSCLFCAPSKNMMLVKPLNASYVLPQIMFSSNTKTQHNVVYCFNSTLNGPTYKMRLQAELYIMRISDIAYGETSIRYQLQWNYVITIQINGWFPYKANVL